jgi:ABC-type nitrate/sulfonate/bicarbonate transport system permease component
MSAVISTEPSASTAARWTPGPRLRFAILTVLNLAAFFTAWELFAIYSGIPRIFLPRFSAILAEFPQMASEGLLIPNLAISFNNFVVGMVVGLVIGLPLAYAIGGIKLLDRVFSPYLWAFYSMPRIILVPLIFLWLGINNNSRLAIVILSVIPQFAVVVMEGVRTTDTTLLNAARSFGASKWQLFSKIILPATTPFIGTGIRLALLRGLIGLYIGELFISSNGLGSIIAYARVRFDTARVFAVLLIFVLLGIFGLALTRYLEAKLTTWRAPADL